MSGFYKGMFRILGVVTGGFATWITARVIIDMLIVGTGIVVPLLKRLSFFNNMSESEIPGKLFEYFKKFFIKKFIIILILAGITYMAFK